MRRLYRALWSLVIVIGLPIAAIVLPKTAIFAGDNANPSLNKAAVNANTPYIVLGMGCFWGSEKRMQALPGVLDVEAGYAGGDAIEPNYQTLHDNEIEIHKGKTLKNHAEVVKVYFDPRLTTLEDVLIQFWENHNPTQGDRQGNDIGSNYRSAVFYRTEEERQLAESTRAIYQTNLKAAGYTDAITTEIAPLKNYTPAEEHHQDYLEKNPLGYCGLGGTGVAYIDPKLGERHHSTPLATKRTEPAAYWDQVKLNEKMQLIAFEAVDCGYCRKFEKDILATWKHPLPIHPTNSTSAPPGWKLKQALFGTPTIVLFKDKQEVSRYTGYQGAEKFWSWLDASLKT